MKKSISVLLLMFSIAASVRAQTHYGTGAGTLGTNHSYFGYYAGNAAQSTSTDNTFFGRLSGRYTTTGNYNTAMGSYSLYTNTTGHSNTAVGRQAMYLNTTGNYNTATGDQALYSNTTGSNNVATGYKALNANTTGNENTAIGWYSLLYSTGNRNVAVGSAALLNNTTGSDNTGVGEDGLGGNTTGNGNSGFGVYTMGIYSGSYNSAFGAKALYSDSYTFCTGSYNTVFGALAAANWLDNVCSLDNMTALGAGTLVTASNQIRFGDSNVTSIGGQVSWSTLSDGRFKRNLKNEETGLDFINQLKPVSYTLDKDAIDKFLGVPDSLLIQYRASRTTPRVQVGFVAQDVDVVIKKSGYSFSGVQAPQNENDPYTIRYEAFVMPLVKAIQELNTSSQSQEARLKEITGQLGTSATTEVLSNQDVLFEAGINSAAGLIQIQVSLPEGTTQSNLVISTLTNKPLRDIPIDGHGSVTIAIPSNQLTPGMYLYTVVADGKVVDKKRLILK